MLRYLTAGESHGPALVVVVEGLPAGLPVTIDEIGAELARRRLGFGRGPRMRFERDDVEFLGGVRHGATLGSPVSIVIHNTEWPKWQEEMSPAPGVTQKPLEFRLAALFCGPWKLREAMHGRLARDQRSTSRARCASIPSSRRRNRRAWQVRR